MTTLTKGDLQLANNSGTFNILAAPANGSFLVSDSTQASGYRSQVAPAAPGANSYSSVSLAFNTNRTPSTTNDTLVIVSLSIALGLGQNSTINFLVNSTTISSQTTSNSLTVALGSITNPMSFSFIVPANSLYKITQSGTGTNTITSIYELTL